MEVVVLIWIVGLLAAVAMPNFMGARERGRDTERKSDLRQIQKAMELYKDTQSPPAYLDNTTYSGLSCGGVWKDVNNTVFMKEFPCDPLSNTRYSYSRPNPPGDTLTYTLFACLENKSDPQAKTADPLECMSLVKYEISNP